MKKKRRLQRSDRFWLIAVALLILLQFWWLPGDPGTPDDTYSNTIEGKRGFFQTLKGLSEAQLLPSVRRESLSLIPEERCTLLILSPDRYPNEREQQELTSFVYQGGTLVFAPNWEKPDCSIPQLHISTRHEYLQEQDTVTAPAAPQSPGTTVAPGTTPSGGLPAEAEDAASDPAEQPSASPTSQSTTIQSWQGIDPPKSTEDVLEDAIRNRPGLQPNPRRPLSEFDEDQFHDVADISTNSQLVSGQVLWRTRASMQTGTLNPIVLVKSSSETTQAAAWNYGNGLVLLSASADVFSNRAMLDEAQAELAVRLVEYAHAHHEDRSLQIPIVVSEFLNATDSYRGPAVLLNPSLRSGTLQLLTVALLAGWFGFHRFGPAKRTNTAQRRSLTESAAAVGNLFFRTQSGDEAVRSYIEYVNTQLQKMYGHSVRIDDTDAIAARTGLEKEDVRLRVANAIALSTLKSATAPQAATAIRDLSEILHRLTGTKDKHR